MYKLNYIITSITTLIHTPKLKNSECVTSVSRKLAILISTYILLPGFGGGISGCCGSSSSSSGFIGSFSVLLLAYFLGWVVESFGVINKPERADL